MTTTSAAARGKVTILAVLATLALGACDPGGAGPGAAAERRSSTLSADESPGKSPDKSPDVRIAAPRGLVGVDEPAVIEASGGTLLSLDVAGRDSSGGVVELEGRLNDDGTSWRPARRLEPGIRYTATGVARRGDGTEQQVRVRFRTPALSLAQQTYPSVAPLEGETVGVGMPVIVSFDLPVQRKAVFEKHMTVSSTPSQPGAWHWVSDHEARWRPKRYWRPGTRVSVDVDVNSLPAGGGVFGQESRVVDFRVGRSVVSKIDVSAHRMDVFLDGRLSRSLQISAGKPGWETRSGTKVVIEKFRSKRMSAATIGVDEDDPEFYDLDNVEYALRVTYSGEFLHAAPWSAGSQGSANVSHGCVGMSTADAAWLYGLTKRGDLVEVTGSERQMTLSNGYGDWNLPFADYREGSALH